MATAGMPLPSQRAATIRFSTVNGYGRNAVASYICIANCAILFALDLVLRRPETSATNRLQMHYKMLEVDAQAEREAAVVRCIELVVTDVRESDIVGEVGVEEVVRHTATEAQTGIEALEVMV